MRRASPLKITNFHWNGDYRKVISFLFIFILKCIDKSANVWYNLHRYIYKKIKNFAAPIDILARAWYNAQFPAPMSIVWPSSQLLLTKVRERSSFDRSSWAQLIAPAPSAQGHSARGRARVDQVLFS
jgi:hypothetical protein